MSDIEIPESRANALLKEERSAMAGLADCALIVTGWSEEAEEAGDWDEDAAKAETRKAPEIAGLIPPDEPSQPYKQRGIETLSTNYERPGRSTR